MNRPEWLPVRMRVPVPALAALAATLAVGAWGAGGDQPTDRVRRRTMLTEQIQARGITDPVVLAAMRDVPRHEFVPEHLRPQAYEDGPLPIGEGQTISQPFVVAAMTQALRPKKGMKVLEVGTGSGYQAAVLAACGCEVYSVEVVPSLGRRAEAVLRRLRYTNVHVRIGDGYDGWPEHAPFDAVILTAAPERIPAPLLDQLRVGGRLIAPVGRERQDLVLVTKTPEGPVTRILDAVRFVPMTGKAQAKPE